MGCLMGHEIPPSGPGQGWGFSLESPLIGSLAFLLSVSAWAKLFARPPPQLELASVIVAKCGGVGVDAYGIWTAVVDFGDYLEADRHSAHLNGFPQYLAVWGVPKLWAMGGGDAIRWGVGMIELVVLWNLAIFRSYDHRMLACGAAVILHLLLLSSMLLAAAEEGSASHGNGDLPPHVASRDSPGDAVASILAVESMLIQMLAGSLVLFGLKQVLPRPPSPLHQHMRFSAS